MLPGVSGVSGKGRSSWAATLTIASGEVASDLTNFPLYVDLADMSGGFWANTNEGKDVRAFIGGVQIPVDVVWCSVAERKGAMFLKVGTLASGSDTIIKLLGDGFSDRLADDNANGRNAVWADYHAVFMLGETAGDDRTGGAQGVMSGDPDLFEKIATSSTDLDSHQGICWDGTYYYTTDTNAIYKWDASWSLIASNTDPIAASGISTSPAVNHCGDPDVFNGVLYIPIEFYTDTPSVSFDHPHIARFNASDLSFISATDIDAQGHEASSIAYCPRDGLLYITDYVGNDDKIYKYQLTGAYVGTLTTSVAITDRQGITWWRDHFWISSDEFEETSRVAYDGTVTVDPSGNAGGIGFGALSSVAYEGIGHRDDALLQLIDPGATERVEVWRPWRVSKAAQGGMDCDGTTAMAVIANARSSYTTYTFGCTLNIDTKDANRTAVSYLDESAVSTTNRRQVIAYRHATPSLAIWDVNNSWLEPSPAVNPTIGQSYRVHAVYQGTTARRIYIDGTQRNVQLTPLAVPSDLDTIEIGQEDADRAEKWAGQVGFVYLRPSVLSADWLAAEYSNLNAPSSFYSIA